MAPGPLILPPAYRPAPLARAGSFLVVEGVSGSGKSTVATLLSRTLPARTLHVVPPPFSQVAGEVNAVARALPQFAFYLTGLLHASDLIGQALRVGHVVADRYAASVIANHTAVFRLDHEEVLALAAPYLTYLLCPDVTVYLHTSARELRARMATKADLSDNDQALLGDSGLLRHIQELYDLHAAGDPNAVHLNTDGLHPHQVAQRISEHLAVSHRHQHELSAPSRQHHLGHDRRPSPLNDPPPAIVQCARE